MKKAILLAVMVSVSIIATAQTFDEPTYYKKVKDANPYEWFMTDQDTAAIMIYGDDQFMDSMSAEWFAEYQIDISKPHKIEKDRKFFAHVWYVENEYGGFLKIALYHDEYGKTLIVGKL